MPPVREAELRQGEIVPRLGQGRDAQLDLLVDVTVPFGEGVEDPQHSAPATVVRRRNHRVRAGPRRWRQLGPGVEGKLPILSEPLRPEESLIRRARPLEKAGRVGHLSREEVTGQIDRRGLRVSPGGHVLGGCALEESLVRLLHAVDILECRVHRLEDVIEHAKDHAGASGVEQEVELVQHIADLSCPRVGLRLRAVPSASLHRATEGGSQSCDDGGVVTRRHHGCCVEADEQERVASRQGEEHLGESFGPEAEQMRAYGFDPVRDGDPRVRRRVGGQSGCDEMFAEAEVGMCRACAAARDVSAAQG